MTARPRTKSVLIAPDRQVFVDSGVHRGDWFITTVINDSYLTIITFAQAPDGLAQQWVIPSCYNGCYHVASNS
jgi:hypothetical protein